MKTRPEHTRCARCSSTQHYLTVTNESRCSCEERFVCARCIIDNRDNLEAMLREAQRPPRPPVSRLEPYARQRRFALGAGHHVTTVFATLAEAVAAGELLIDDFARGAPSWRLYVDEFDARDGLVALHVFAVNTLTRDTLVKVFERRRASKHLGQRLGSGRAASKQ